jgi:tetratricopeptide (TPR) repeat protein
VKKPQLITIAVAVFVTGLIYIFGRTVPDKKTTAPAATETHSPDDGHNHGAAQADISIDTILLMAKKQLNPGLIQKMDKLQQAAAKTTDKEEVIHTYHQLSRLWSDSAQIFEPYAWYRAQAARLENSEKTLTFAAHLFLDNLQQDRNPELVKWKALQAKDLFERSLKLNPQNDSSKVGLGACYLFGNISDAPMEGIGKIREVAERDSTNIYAQLTLAKGSVLSGQYDKAINRLQTVTRLQPANIEACLMLADVYERTGNKKAAISWYQQSLPHIHLPEAKAEITKRIEELKK